MTELPDGWRRDEMQELVLEIKPGFASGKHNKTNDGIPHLRPMNVSRAGRIDLTDVKYVVDDSDRRLQVGDVLFNNTNSPDLVGKTALVAVEGEFAFSNHMTRLRVRDDVMSPHYLAYRLHWNWLNGYFKSICSNHVNQASIAGKRLSVVEIEVPPLLEQDEIVRILDTQLARLDTVLGAVQAVRDKADQFRRSLLHAAFTGQLTQPDPRRMTDLPSSWDVTQLDDFATLTSGFAYKSSTWTDEGVPVIKIANVRNGRVDMAGCDFISHDLAGETEKFAVQRGDLLITLTGEIGATGVYSEPEEARLNQRVGRFQFIDDSIESRSFLRYSLESPKLRDAMWASAKGVAQPNISPKQVSALPLPVPPPNERVEIVRILDTQLSRLDGALEVADHVEAECGRLRRSLLQAAFTGELTKNWREANG